MNAQDKHTAAMNAAAMRPASKTLKGLEAYAIRDLQRLTEIEPAARAMLAALTGLHSQVMSARAHPRWAHLSNEQTNMLSAYMLQASKAIAQAEAAGITTEGN